MLNATLDHRTLGELSGDLPDVSDPADCFK